MNGIKLSDVASVCHSPVIISRASLIICEYLIRSSVSVGEAVRRSISTLKQIDCLNGQGHCRGDRTYNRHDWTWRNNNQQKRM